MKQICCTLCTLFCLLLANYASAQNFKVPAGYNFGSIDGYHKYDKDIIRFVNWLEKEVPGEDKDNVRGAIRFFGEWQAGCPYVRYQRNVKIDSFLADSPEYKIYYIAGWVKYSLTHGMTENKVECAYAGIRTVLNVYLEYGHSKTHANLAVLVKLDNQDKLRAWVQEKVK